MKLKDLHTNLNREINLLKFFPKKEISVDSFWIEKNVIQDISKNKIKKSIKLKNNSQIKVKKINKNNNFDVLKNVKKKRDIDLIKKVEKKYLPLLKGVPYFEVWKIWGWLTNKLSNKIIKIFSIILFIIFLVFLDKITIQYLTNSAYKKINLVKNNIWSQIFEEEINSANNRLKIAEILFLPFRIIPWEKIDNAHYTILWWIKLTNLLLNIWEYTEKTKKYIEKKWEENIMYSQLLENSKNIFKYSEQELNNIIKIYSKIHFSNNVILQKKIDYSIWELNKINFFVNIINSDFNILLDILWHNKRKKYLVVFQNNDEIRPQWGFMWSMWILEIFRWKIEKFEKRDVYDFEFKIKKEKFNREVAPEWINKLTPKLGLRDSNYYINDKDSSEKIKFFIKKAWFDIDWIIYLNQNTLLKILDLIWWYNSKVLNTQINSSNFSVIMSSLVEAKKTKNWTLWTPKKILFDFIEEFKNIIKSKKINKSDILKIIINDIKNRDIKFYDFNKKEREFLEELNLYNPIKFNKSLDFAYPVFTSISGNKSDRYINIYYNKKIKRLKNCDYRTSFEISLKHNFNKIDLEYNKQIFNKFWIKNNLDKLLSIQWNWENKQYIRIILPKNAIITKNSKILSIKDYKKRWKVIDFYLNTKVWETSNFKLDYTIPNKKCLLYNFELYKQPWIKKYDLDYNLDWEKKEFRNIDSDLFVY